MNFASASCSTFSGSGGSLGSRKNSYSNMKFFVCLMILPSSLSSAVPCWSPPADGGGANENFGGGGVKLIEDAELIDDFSVLNGLAKLGGLNVD